MVRYSIGPYHIVLECIKIGRKGWGEGGGEGEGEGEGGDREGIGTLVRRNPHTGRAKICGHGGGCTDPACEEGSGVKEPLLVDSIREGGGGRMRERDRWRDGGEHGKERGEGWGEERRDGRLGRDLHWCRLVRVR